jgi:hypothetical protein
VGPGGGVDRLGVVDVAQPVPAEAGHSGIGCRGEGLAGEQRAAQSLGQLLEPAGVVDRRPDDGEVEPAPRPDVAEPDLAEMQRQPEGERRLAGGVASPVQRVDRREGGLGGGERPAAGVGGVVAGGKDRQQAVAEELEDLAAGLGERGGQAVESVVERGDHHSARHVVGEPREAP